MKAIIILWVLGLSFIGFGLWAVFAPHSLTSLMDLELNTPKPTTEIRAFYGGLEIGLGVFLIVAARQIKHQKSALLVSALVLGFIALCRIFGIAVDGSTSHYHFVALSAEVLGTFLAAWALNK